jgi:hypothetical protein
MIRGPAYCTEVGNVYVGLEIVGDGFIELHHKVRQCIAAMIGTKHAYLNGQIIESGCGGRIVAVHSCGLVAKEIVLPDRGRVNECQM